MYALQGLVLWAVGHMAAVWAAKRDPSFVEVVRRHVRYPLHLVWLSPASKKMHTT
jgi:type IV secretory pathway TrbD component